MPPRTGPKGPSNESSSDDDDEQLEEIGIVERRAVGRGAAAQHRNSSASADPGPEDGSEAEGNKAAGGAKKQYFKWEKYPELDKGLANVRTACACVQVDEDVV